MPWKLSDAGQEWRLELSGRLDIRHAARLASELRQAVDAGPGRPWQVAAAGLEDADTSILQVLGALRREAGSWRWETVPAGLTRAAAERGWEQLLAPANGEEAVS